MEQNAGGLSPASLGPGPGDPRSSLLARAVWEVMQANDDAHFVELSPGHAVIKWGTKAVLVLGAWDPARGEVILEGLKQIMKDHKGSRLVVGLTGGGDGVWQALKKARPMMTNVKVGQFHLDDDAQIRGRDAWPFQQPVEGLAHKTPPAAEEWAQLMEQSRADRADHLEKVQNARGFAAVLQARRPVATWTLAGILVAVFGLELALGGSQSTPVLLRMGALSPDHVRAGEWWRLFSCTFLHSGFLHLGFNTFVLYILGSSLERVLGSWRFLLLYTLSCLGGSLLSFTFLEGFSVGASGGLWGLLGAEAVLAWRSQGLLPRQMIKGARRATTFNLGINLLNSFRPHVDMWAHFGGGAVGAGLMLSGLLTRRLPRLGALADGGQLEREEDADIPSGPTLKAVASGMAGLFLLGLGLGLIQGRPWALDQPFEAVRTPVADLGISMLLPPGLEQHLDDRGTGAGVSVNVGNILADPGAVIVTAYPQDLSDPAAREAERSALVEELREIPDGARLTAGPEATMIGDMEGVNVAFRYESGLEEELAFVLLGNALVKVNALRWPAFSETVEPGYAAGVLASLEITGAGEDLPTNNAAMIERLTPLAEGGDAAAQNNLAWLLATCPDPAFHDGEAALRFARMAVAQGEDAANVDTLAAAYARAGQFAEAVKTQQRGLELLTDEADRAEFEQRLELYRNGEAYTER